AHQAYVALGGQAFMRERSQDAWNEFRPYFDDAPVYGHGPSMEDFTKMTPLTVGSPEQVVERTLEFRDWVGDYQRQMFLIDHAGLPAHSLLDPLGLFGDNVLPVWRQDFAKPRPADVPAAPTHDFLKQRQAAGDAPVAGGGAESQAYRARQRVQQAKSN